MPKRTVRLLAVLFVVGAAAAYQAMAPAKVSAECCQAPNWRCEYDSRCYSDGACFCLKKCDSHVGWCTWIPDEMCEASGCWL